MSLVQSLILRITVLFVLYSNGLLALTFTKEETLWIKANPEVTLGSDYSWAPYDFVDKKGNYTGIAADFLALISKKSGLRFKVSTDI